MHDQSSLTGSTTRNSSLSDSDCKALDPPGNTHARATSSPPLQQFAGSGGAVQSLHRPTLERIYRDILKARDPQAVKSLYHGMGEVTGQAIKRRTALLALAMLHSDQDYEKAAKNFDAAAEETSKASAASLWATDRQLLSGETQAIMALAAAMRAKGAADSRDRSKLIAQATDRAGMLSATLRSQPTPIVALAISVTKALKAPPRGEAETAMLREVLAHRPVQHSDNVMSWEEKVGQYLSGLQLPEPRTNDRPSTSSGVRQPFSARRPARASGPQSISK